MDRVYQPVDRHVCASGEKYDAARRLPLRVLQRS